MKLQVLGCAGGIGGRERLTTTLLVDDDILLDAGTGLTSLDIDQLILIDHVFITHCHLDHVAGLALLLDAVQGRKSGPVTVHATEKVIASLKKHLFNWVLWPDFAVIPSPETPTLRWEAIDPNGSVEIDGRIICAYPVNHTAGSSAYWVHNAKSGFLFTGDMAATAELWAALAQEKQLTKVIVDCSFANADMEIANRSLHFCPRSLLADIQSVPLSVEFLIYHLKPGHEDLIMQELRSEGGARGFKALKCGDTFVF
ncbi:3',5'-cyclic-nucleotide phosphodiesterase [Noviherbaspirillum sp.]|mgnify:CR=1 FL=1|jgi:3',5'-cyclic-nucleotide phosphodiesterase|uniref:3',5'-cyclic-nucleotide phosphodiesterase n=1 Tax=Noviherbaspirillum sp. TaxID=1926288 RepID=UPI0025D7444E|nr:3',5'-cyclic-nucleotide phosphodiesterase [Noviherbaspirillum sp.]